MTSKKPTLEERITRIEIILKMLAAVLAPDRKKKPFEREFK